MIKEDRTDIVSDTLKYLKRRMAERAQPSDLPSWADPHELPTSLEPAAVHPHDPTESSTAPRGASQGPHWTMQHTSIASEYPEDGDESEGERKKA